MPATGGVVGPGTPWAERPLSVILFDEIEKAHPAVWNAMLGILEDGRLTLGDNTTTGFTRSIHRDDVERGRPGDGGGAQ